VSLYATRRQDGRRRFTIKTEHDLTGADVMVMLAKHSARGYGYVEGNWLTVGGLEEIIRKVVTDRGDESFAAIDWYLHDSEADVAQLFTWAYREVSRLYPRLRDNAMDTMAAKLGVKL